MAEHRTGPYGRIPAGARASIVPVDRRSFLTSVGAVVAGGIPAAAAVGLADAPDPIFAAIDTHKQREAEFRHLCVLTDEVAAREQGRQVTAADEQAYSAACDRVDAALEALALVIPQTASGIQALLAYFVDEYLCGAQYKIIEACMRSIIASPALMGAAHVQALDSPRG